MEEREGLQEDSQGFEAHHLKSKRPFFSCSLCREKYKNPKVLSCWHSFCLECLAKYIPENSISAVCPVCNILCVLPKQGFDYLPNNWMLTSMKDGKSPSVDLLTITTSSRMLDTIDSTDLLKDDQCNLDASNDYDFKTANTFSSNNLENNNCSNNCNNSSFNNTGNEDTFNNTNDTFNNTNDTFNNTNDTKNINNSLQNAYMTESLKHSESDSFTNSLHTPPLSKESNQATKQQYHDTQCDTASSSAILMDESLTGELSQSALFSQSYRSSSEYSSEKLYCKLHPLQNLEMYCQVCDIALCSRCAEMGHDDHVIVSIDSVVQTQKITLANLLEQLKIEYKDVENSKIYIERVKTDLEFNSNKVKDQLTSRHNTIVNLLQKKLNANLEELDSIYKDRNDILDKQLLCINEDVENIHLSNDLVEKILDSERSELILLANKCYFFKDYDSNGTTKQTPLKKQAMNSLHLSRPIESSFLCFDPEGYENLEKYISYLNGVVSDKNLCSNMIGFSTEDLNKPVNLNRKFRLAIYLLEDITCIANDYLSRLNNAIHALLLLPNGRKKLLEFVLDMSESELGYVQFTPEQLGTHFLELYNFGVLVRGTPVELKVTKFSLATNASSNHYNHYPAPKTKKPTTKRLSTQTSQPKLKSSSSIFLNKSLPSKQPQSSFVSKTLTKTSNNPAPRYRSNTNLIRPPWNNSVTKNSKAPHHTSSQPLRRSLSSTVPRVDPSHKLSNTSLHKLDKTAKFASRKTSHPAINTAFKDRIDGKLNLQNKIDEEDDREIDDFNHRGVDEAPPNVTAYNRLHSNKLNKTAPVTQTPDSRPTRRVATFSQSQTRASRHASLSNRLVSSKVMTSRNSLKPPNEIVRKFGGKGKRLGEFNSLQDVAFHNGLILASDAKNQCIQVIDFSSGKFTKQIILGEDLSKPPSPSGLAVDSNDLIYVSDLENHCVVVLDCKGHLVRKIGQNHLKGPKGIVLSDEEVVVADMKGCGVHIYNKTTGALLGKFGSQGYKEENLCSPQFCALTADQQHIVVSDFRTDKVKIFTWEGHLLKCFGSSGTRLGQLSGPTGVAVHPDTGNIYVCDFSNTRIQVFSKDGLFLEKLNFSLSAPQGLCFLDEEMVMVADAGNHCIKIAKIKKSLN